MAAGEAWCERVTARVAAGEQVQFMIVDPEGTYIGNMGLDHIRAAEQPCEIGCWLATPFVGRGYATEAVRP